MSQARLLDVHVQRVLHGRLGPERRPTVHCPLRERTLPLEECLACKHCSGLRPGLGGRSAVVCGGAPEARAASALPQHWRAGEKDASTTTPVADAMTRDVICVGHDVGTDALTALLLDQRISAAIVVADGGKPLGVVSTTDLLRERHERGDTGVDERGCMPRGMHEIPGPVATASEVMTAIPLALHESDTIARAAALMAFEGVHRLIVVGDDGTVVGVLASTDVLRWMGQRAGFLIPPATCRQRAQT